MTLDSAIKLDPPLYEIIVVDGDSTDGTKGELLFYQEQFNEKGVHFHFVSEPDKGIYDAMNKGIDMAEGTWLIFMNVRDMFATEHVTGEIFADPVPDGLSSQSIYVSFCDSMEMRKDHGLGNPEPVIFVKKMILRFLDFWDKHMPWKLTRKFFP